MSNASKRLALLQRQWNQGGWLSTVLRPLATLTAWAVARKRQQYRSGRRRTFRPPVPVVVIGNIYVGGTGKTTVVIATVKALQARGWTPGVISRGYGVKIGPHSRVGIGAPSALEFGDEPALIARATKTPIAVHPKRARAVQALLHQFPKTDVIVCDDGLQHLALARDLEIVVQDSRGIGNGKLLPAGPLREPTSRLHEVHVVITNKNAAEAATIRTIAASSTGPLHLDMWLEPADAHHVQGQQANRPLSDFASGGPFKRVAAAAGIGNPERFFATLSAAGISLAASLALPDHHDFSHSPFTDLSADAILITSKDAIKCALLKDPRLWEIPVTARFSDPLFFNYLSERLRLVIPGKYAK
jgi:tetraacyldisaccharide 4'-kinase